MPGPASHLFLTSFSKATRRSIVAKAEEVGEQVRGEGNVFFMTQCNGVVKVFENCL